MAKVREQVQCPKCQGVFAHQGALNLHLSRSACGGEIKPKKKPVEIEGCPECGEALRALRPNVYHERMKMSEGYREVCTVCLELI